MNSTEEQISVLQTLQAGRCQKTTLLGQLWAMKLDIFAALSMTAVIFFSTHLDFYRGIAIGIGFTVLVSFIGAAGLHARHARENQGLKPIRQTKDWLGWLCCLLIWTALTLRIWIALT